LEFIVVVAGGGGGRIGGIYERLSNANKEEIFDLIFFYLLSLS
jgi:hypothetical protein